MFYFVKKVFPTNSLHSFKSKQYVGLRKCTRRFKQHIIINKLV